MKMKLLAVILCATMVLGLCACGTKEEVVETEEVAEVVKEVTEPTPEPTAEPEPTEEPSIVEEVVEEVFLNKYPQSFAEISDEDMSWAIQSGMDAVNTSEGDVSEAKRAYLVGRKNDNTWIQMFIIYYTTKSDGRQGYQVAVDTLPEFDENRSIKDDKGFSKSSIYITSFETFEEELPLRLSEPIILDVKDF